MRYGGRCGESEVVSKVSTMGFGGDKANSGYGGGYDGSVNDRVCGRRSQQVFDQSRLCGIKDAFSSLQVEAEIL